MSAEATMVQRPVPAARAIILDERGQVLVLKRADGSTAGGRWSLPGGKVDCGQTVEEAVRREVLEETGLACTEARFLFYQDSPAYEASGMHCINFYFECRVTGTVTLNEESAEALWIGAGELPSLRLAFRHDEALARYWGARA